jgi:hypothetical protein
MKLKIQTILSGTLVVGLAISTARADMVDLTSLGSSGVINGAIFEQGSVQPAGTGVFLSFVRIGGRGVTEGYNTDGPLEFDTLGGVHTRSLLLNEVPLVQRDGVPYREFLLNINEPVAGEMRFLSLDGLSIHLEATGDLSGYPQNFSAPIYDIGDNWVKLDASLSAGSGESDMRLLVPDSLFVSANPFVYLYSRFGEQFSAEGGFEEWGVIPAPGAALLGLLGLSMVGGTRRRLR